MKKIKVELAYASLHQQWLLPLDVAFHSTIEEVIKESGILLYCPEIDLTHQKIGVFGKKRCLTDTVCAGDRIEIYRPLIIDPKEARRLRTRIPDKK